MTEPSIGSEQMDKAKPCAAISEDDSAVVREGDGGSGDATFPNTLEESLGIVYTVEEKGRVEGLLPVTDLLLQGDRYARGVVSSVLLESVASRGATLIYDLEIERPFGVEARFSHKKALSPGVLKAVAELARVEGDKSFWNVSAWDEQGDAVSVGEFVCKTVSIERLIERGLVSPEPNG